MPRIKQTIVIEPGGARRLMVRGKGPLRVKEIVGSSYRDGPAGWNYYPETKSRPLDGPYIGTKKMPSENAKKHPLTGQPQTRYLLVRHPRRDYHDNHHAVPPSDAEFYWQKSQMKNGRFYPDTASVSPTDPQPDQTTP